MTRLWHRWVDALQRTESAETLAVFRIACGLCVLLTVSTVVWSDLVPVLWLDVADGGFRKLGSGPWLVRWCGGPSPLVIWSLVAMTLVAGASLVLGLGARLTPLVAGQGLWALMSISQRSGGSYDLLLCNALWLLVLSRSTATLSLDCRMQHRVWARDVQIPAWPRYLVAFQLIAVYASTGIQKISVHWTPMGGFSALYYILQQPSWQRFDMTWLAYVYPLTQIATAVTWVWELTSPLLLLVLYYRATRSRRGWLRGKCNRFDLRKPFALIGVSMHLLTWVFMAIGPFTWISLSYYICLLTPDELRALWRRRRGNRAAGFSLRGAPPCINHRPAAEP